MAGPDRGEESLPVSGVHLPSSPFIHHLSCLVSLVSRVSSAKLTSPVIGTVAHDVAAPIADLPRHADNLSPLCVRPLRGATPPRCATISSRLATGNGRTAPQFEQQEERASRCLLSARSCRFSKYFCFLDLPADYTKIFAGLFLLLFL